MRTLLISLALGLGLTSTTHAQEWDVDESASELTFSVMAFDQPLGGEFETFDATIRLDPNNLSDAFIEARIGTDSGAVDDPSYQETFLSRWGLAVEAHPEARFISNDITRSGQQYSARGDLTIKGMTVPVTLPFTLDITDGRAVADGRIELDRQRYDVGEEWDDVEDNVTVIIHIEADAIGTF